MCSVRSTDNQIDLLASQTLSKVSSINAEQAKCICATQPYVFVGSWNGKLSIYDVHREFKLVKFLKCKSAVRSICILDPQTLIIGENEGWFEIVRVSTNLELVEIIHSKKFDSVGHVFTLQLTSEQYQIVVCSYTGVHFVKMVLDESTVQMSLYL